MANTLRRVRFLIDCKFKELWARRMIKNCKRKIKGYKNLLNSELTLSEEEENTFKQNIRVLKIEIMAWKSLLTNYRCPFGDCDEMWK